MNDFASFMASYKRHRQAVTEANALNKTAVFAALVQAGITLLTIDFDGEGDSGQLNEIVALSGDTPVTLPATPLTLHEVLWNSDQLNQLDTTLPEAIETLCYGYLEQEHDGWENNDGAYGAFRFDVAACMIELEFNGRFTDVITSSHSW